MSALLLPPPCIPIRPSVLCSLPRGRIEAGIAPKELKRRSCFPHNLNRVGVGALFAPLLSVAASLYRPVLI